MSQRLMSWKSLPVALFMYCLLRNASSASSRSDSTVRRTDRGRALASSSDNWRLTAAPQSWLQKRDTFIDIIALGDSQTQQMKRNPHNLYRLVSRLFNILKSLGTSAVRIILPNKVLIQCDNIAVDALSLFRKNPPVNHSEKNGKKRFLEPVGSFFSKRFPRNDNQNKNNMKTTMPSFPNIFQRIKWDNNDQSPKKQYNIFSRRNQINDVSTHPVFVLPTVWGDLTVTEKEKLSLVALNERRMKVDSMPGLSPWLKKATATDFLRFLRVKNGNEEESWAMIIAHAKWRISKYGADTIVNNREFDGSVLHRELFWLGVSTGGVPTLVIRTQAHDGADYNEDPKIFTR